MTQEQAQILIENLIVIKWVIAYFVTMYMTNIYLEGYREYIVRAIGLGSVLFVFAMFGYYFYFKSL